MWLACSLTPSMRQTGRGSALDGRPRRVALPAVCVRKQTVRFSKRRRSCRGDLQLCNRLTNPAVGQQRSSAVQSKTGTLPPRSATAQFGSNLAILRCSVLVPRLDLQRSQLDVKTGLIWLQGNCAPQRVHCGACVIQIL